MAEFVYMFNRARKAVHDKVILDDVTVGVYPGAKIGVVGPNGAGKSTLLKVMAGLEDVSNGEARLSPGYTVGILQQEPPLDEDKTVRENIEQAFGDVLAKIERFNQVSAEMADPDADFDALMAEMGQLQDEIDAANGWDLDSQLSQAMDALQCPDPDSPVTHLSGGERRRVALCRLLLEAPDLLLLDDLSFERAPHRVYAAGKLVAEDGLFVGDVAPETARVQELEATLRGSVRLPELSPEVFSYDFQPGSAVIDVIPGNAITGAAHPDSSEGLRRIMLIERHGRGVAAQAAGADGAGTAGCGLTGTHIGRGWVRGFTITGGAIASTVGHDSHNVCVVGDNPHDMFEAVRNVGQGGFVLVRDGAVVAKLALPLGGLMSDGTAEDVAREHDAFVQAARATGIKPPLGPIMGMIFLPLPVIPTLRIRPEGVFDVTTFTYAS